MSKIILTGDRPTGRLHIGHYVGSLKKRIELQNKAEYDAFYIMIADAQALTDNADNPQKIQNSIMEVMLDYLAVGLDPKKVTFFIQSGIPALPELTAYYMNLVSYTRLIRNPTVKSEIASKHFSSVPIGFVNYPISQAADITAFKASIIPVGEDQEPMIEQTREIVRSFNRIYQKNVLVECKTILATNEASKRLPGIDGNEKMSKSLNNGIYLSDNQETIRKKINDIVTFPRALSDPGIIEGNVLFTYLDAFSTDESFNKYYPEFKNLSELKNSYATGGIGDRRIKDFLYDVIDNELAPIRQRREEWRQKTEDIKQILRDGTHTANRIANTTLSEVKAAMGIDYFNNMLAIS